MATKSNPNQSQIKPARSVRLAGGGVGQAKQVIQRLDLKDHTSVQVP